MTYTGRNVKHFC